MKYAHFSSTTSRNTECSFPSEPILVQKVREILFQKLEKKIETENFQDYFEVS